jgi:hypothetical protein
VDPGASKVTFWAWGDAASVGSTIAFQAGDIGSSATPYRDSFSAFSSVVLTATPKKYEIDLGGADYSAGVISAFGWTAERTNLSTLTFYVDGMRWE